MNEVVVEPWRLRSVLVEDIEVEGDETTFPTGHQDVWIWFLGRMDEDQWFAHGISDHGDFTTDDLNDVVAATDGAEMDVMLAYGGLRWDEITNGDAVVLAQVQRAMVNDMDPKMKADLMSMGRSEIDNIRKAEENDIDHRLN